MTFEASSFQFAIPLGPDLLLTSFSHGLEFRARIVAISPPPAAGPIAQIVRRISLDHLCAALGKFVVTPSSTTARRLLDLLLIFGLRNEGGAIRDNRLVTDVEEADEVLGRIGVAREVHG